MRTTLRLAVLSLLLVGPAGIPGCIPFKLAKQNVISEFEKRYISRLLAQHDGNISAAARAAGIDRMSIHKMLHRLGLANPGRD